MASVLWSENPEEDRAGTEGPDAADVDDSFATRRLRRWLKGMFGGSAKPPVRDSGPEEGARGNREAAKPPVRDSGPEEGARGNREVSPTKEP
jgi:hypothetical protein